MDWWRKAYRALEDCALKSKVVTGTAFSFNEADQDSFWSYVETEGLDESLKEPVRSRAEVEAEHKRVAKLRRQSDLELGRLLQGYISEEHQATYLASPEYKEYQKYEEEIATLSADAQSAGRKELGERALVSRRNFLFRIDFEQREAERREADKREAKKLSAQRDEAARVATMRGRITSVVQRVKARFSQTRCRPRSGGAGPVGPSGGAGSGAGADFSDDSDE